MAKIAPPCRLERFQQSRGRAPRQARACSAAGPCGTVASYPMTVSVERAGSAPGSKAFRLIGILLGSSEVLPYPGAEIKQQGDRPRPRTPRSRLQGRNEKL